MYATCVFYFVHFLLIYRKSVLFQVVNTSQSQRTKCPCCGNNFRDKFAVWEMNLCKCVWLLWMVVVGKTAGSGIWASEIISAIILTKTKANRVYKWRFLHSIFTMYPLVEKRPIPLLFSVTTTSEPLYQPMLLLELVLCQPVYACSNRPLPLPTP